jgi:hypothetical protein
MPTQTLYFKIERDKMKILRSIWAVLEAITKNGSERQCE